MTVCYTGQKAHKEIFEVFNETMAALFEQDPRVVYLDADLMGSMKTQTLWKKYPKNVFNTGIQEANMAGVAAGLFLNGFKPYIHSFSPFVSRRIFDQLFVSVAYAQKSVRVIASDAGIMATHNGGTHMSFEDIAMIRAIPGACIVDVTDPTMFAYVLKATKERPGLTYLRTARRDLKDIYSSDEVFVEGKGKVLRDGKDVTLIGCGIMVATCLEAAKVLTQRGISAKVIDIVTIKPLDTELVLECAKQTRGIVTCENANVLGGLGGAVAEYLSQIHPTRVLRVGIEDQFGCVGNETFLREKYGLTVQHIVNKVNTLLQK